MKTIVLSTLLMFAGYVHSAVPSISEVRKLYMYAANNKSQCEALLAKVNAYNESFHPTLGAYKACATMIMAKHVSNPFDKLSKFSEGKALLEKCIARDSNKIELQFLRLAIQNNAPAFLGYKSDIQKDKTFLLKSLSSLKDTQLKAMIASFLSGSGLLTATEKQQLKNSEDIRNFNTKFVNPKI